MAKLVTAKLSDFEVVKYSYEAHSPVKVKQLPWPVCRHCGLVYLKNEFTRWCIGKGCNNSYHPEFGRAKL
jgi:hypothetical protein